MRRETKNLATVQEEPDGENYMQNYYESEGEENKGSDGEPTF